MRPILPPGGRGRKLLGRMGRPLPRDRAADDLRCARALGLQPRGASDRADRVEAEETESGPADGIPGSAAAAPCPRHGSPRGAWPVARRGSDRRRADPRDAGTEWLAARSRWRPSSTSAAAAGASRGTGPGLRGPAIHGADISRRAVRWCRRNLRIHADRPLRPRAASRIRRGAFDFVYALSVLTHLTEETGSRWLARAGSHPQARGAAALHRPWRALHPRAGRPRRRAVPPWRVRGRRAPGGARRQQRLRQLSPARVRPRPSLLPARGRRARRGRLRGSGGRRPDAHAGAGQLPGSQAGPASR